MKTLNIDGKSLSISDLAYVASGIEYKFKLTDQAVSSVTRANKAVLRTLEKGEPVYGINTGLGYLKDVSISRPQIKDLQKNTLRSHSVGVGTPFPDDIVRAILLVRANTLAQGMSGVRVEMINYLLRMIERGVCPIIPESGSVGASGDLAPLAHIGLAMLGEGRARINDTEMHAHKALSKAGMAPFDFEVKESLSLINGTQVMTAVLAFAINEIETLLKIIDISAAISVEVLWGSVRPFHPDIQKCRNHWGQSITAENIRRLTNGSPIVAAHDGCKRVQDAYSMRCIPQVHGAVKDVFINAIKIVEIELNSVTDNPIYLPNSDEFISGGNFHGEPMALWADYLTIALTDLCNIVERRIERLVNPHHSDLPAFLVQDGGIYSGFMMAQVTAAALASENKVYAHPASVDSIPTSANQEDHVSMGMTSVKKLLKVIENVRMVVNIEMLAACQGADFRKPLGLANGTCAAYDTIRENISFLDCDRPLSPDIESVSIHHQKIVENVEAVIGPIVVSKQRE